MDLIPWNPFGDTLRPRGPLERIMDDPFRFFGRVNGQQGPAVEVFERGSDVVIRAELAGCDPQDVDVRVTDDSASIRADRRADERGEDEGYYHSERQYGSFVRTVALPAPVDATKARARFHHGLLEIVAPRRDEADRRGRKLNVEVQ